MLRLVFVLLALVLSLAGCVDEPVVPASEEQPVLDADPESADSGAPSAAAEVEPSPFAAEGRAWLPPSSSGAREETRVAFPVNGTGMRGEVGLVLGMRYGVDLPPVLADVEVEVRAPDGTVVATARLSPDEREAHVEMDGLTVGEHALVLLSYGGSGGGTGDYVDWQIGVS